MDRPRPDRELAPAPGSPSPPLVGLYGGSFDPIHLGHLSVAERAREAFGLDQVWFIPAARPPHKPGKRLASGRDRVAMLELALADLPWAKVEPLELHREGPSYTFDTVEELLARHPDWIGELHLLLGGDNLPGFPGWHRALELLDLVQPIVLRREGDGADPVEEIADRLPGWAQRKLQRGFLNVPPVPGRASDIRRQFGEGAQSVPNLPNGIESYIRMRGLYGPVDATHA